MNIKSKLPTPPAVCASHGVDPLATCAAQGVDDAALIDHDPRDDSPEIMAWNAYLAGCWPEVPNPFNG